EHIFPFRIDAQEVAFFISNAEQVEVGVEKGIQFLSLGLQGAQGALQAYTGVCQLLVRQAYGLDKEHLVEEQVGGALVQVAKQVVGVVNHGVAGQEVLAHRHQCGGGKQAAGVEASWLQGVTQQRNGGDRVSGNQAEFVSTLEQRQAL